MPTTVLAYQHFQTFRDRLKGLPCRVEYLSRARTAAQSKAVLKGLKEGDVNILIGTHRILGKDVQFKDLGLLIVDEEQKFGVSVKEKVAATESERGHIDNDRYSDSPYASVLADGCARSECYLYASA